MVTQVVELLLILTATLGHFVTLLKMVVEQLYGDLTTSS
tara:strand:+ start:275 stop:391 length:117 start_codon:yes stop_codon:yes gene_type:complete